MMIRMSRPGTTEWSANAALGRDRAFWLAVAVLAVATIAAYATSFSVPLLFDDWVTLRDNPRLRQLWPLWAALSPPEFSGVGGRPIAHLSFVLNYAVTGDSVAGYHAVNLAIHLAAGLTLFGIARRTIVRTGFHGRWGAAVPWIALAVAAWWTLHPVQTQSVTYVSQRTESLMGLFYLLTLYAFIRAIDAGGSRAWFATAVASCFAGMATKEGMVTVPVIVLLYDYAFVTRSLREAWRRRWPWYVAMASSWLLLAMLMSGLRGRGVGFGLGMSAWSYLLIECRAVMNYFTLGLWPAPLVFDYGVDLTPGFVEATAAFGVVVLAGVTVLALWRWPAFGFLGAWFLITLSPTSSIVPIPLQPISENRMYLSLAAVVAAVVVATSAWGGRRMLPAFAVVAVALGCLTAARNIDYRSEISIWADTVAKRPGSSRAHSNYGHALQAAGRLAEAKQQHEIALQLRPNYAEAHANLAAILGQTGSVDLALQHSRRAVEIDPRNAAGFFNLGVGWSAKGDHAQSIAAYESALRINPQWAEAHSNLALEFLRIGRVPEAIARAEAALQLKPQLVDARYALGCGLAMSGRGADAVPMLQAVIAAQPNHLEAYQNLTTVLTQLGRLAEAVTVGEAGVRLSPTHGGMNFVLANALLNSGRAADAVRPFQVAVQAMPNAPEAWLNFGVALQQVGRTDDAVNSYQRALQLNPNLAAAKEKLQAIRK